MQQNKFLFFLNVWGQNLYIIYDSCINLRSQGSLSHLPLYPYLESDLPNCPSLFWLPRKTQFTPVTLDIFFPSALYSSLNTATELSTYLVPILHPFLHINSLLSILKYLTQTFLPSATFSDSQLLQYFIYNLGFLNIQN